MVVRKLCSHGSIAMLIAAVVAMGLLVGVGPAGAADRARISAGPDMVIGEDTGYVDVPVTLDVPGTDTVTVNYATANGTAGSKDYRATKGTLTYAPGDTTKTIRVEITDDPLVEPMESFTLTLTAPGGATIERSSSTISIDDDD